MKLHSPTGNRLEKLHGDRSGQNSIRINQRGRFYELLADLTGEDGPLAEMEGLDEVGAWLVVEQIVRIPRTTGLLDPETREKLPKLNSEEEKGLDPLTQNDSSNTPAPLWTKGEP